MEDDLKLVILKQDLEILHSQKDDYLKTLIQMATELIEMEGISLTDDYLDASLISMYAAYLYRKRANDENPMPRMLRYALNNRLFSQKVGEVDV